MKQIYLRQASKGGIIYSIGEYHAKLMRATKMCRISAGAITASSVKMIAILWNDYCYHKFLINKRNRWPTWQKAPIISLNVNLSNAKHKLNIHVLNTAPRTRVIIHHGILLQDTSDVELWLLYSSLAWITCRTNSRLGGEMRRHYNGKIIACPRLHNSILSPIGWNQLLSTPAVATRLLHWVL